MVIRFERTKNVKYGTMKNIPGRAYRKTEKEERETPETQAARTVRDRFVTVRRIALLTGSRAVGRTAAILRKEERSDGPARRAVQQRKYGEESAVPQEKRQMDVRRERFRAAFFRKKILEENAAYAAGKGGKDSAGAVRNVRRSSLLTGAGFPTVFVSAVCVLTVLVTALTAGVASSPYGIFLSAEREEEEGIRTAVRDLSREFYGRVREACGSAEWDRMEMISDDGCYGVRWDAVLPVFAVLQGTGGGTGAGAVSVGKAEKEELRQLMNRSASVTWRVEETVTDEEENEKGEEEKEEEREEEGEEETRTVRVLYVTVTHTDPADAAGLDEAQRELLAEMTGPDCAAMWAKLLGGLTAGGGIMEPDPSRVPAGGLTWPLPVPGRITSGFGTRTDPFDGTQKFHGGLDIAAAGGTPVLAAADGTVTVANAMDPWGGGYGYYVILDHGNGLSTLYAHCSSVCVLPGGAAVRGEVIGYVGSTGNSTGDHLHFEVRADGEKTDPMLYFLA